MEIAKPSEADKEYFRSVFEDRPELEIKPMFGNLAAFVMENQQMCAGLFGPLVGVRLGDVERDELAAVKGAGPFGPAERPMTQYVSMPQAWRTGHDVEVERWVDLAIAHTATLPAKKKRPKNKR